MDNSVVQILLADDDKDDCQFFKEALEELNISCKLTIVNDGQQLMQLLTYNSDNLPNVLFLDLNMPRKNGAACLEEIKYNPKLKTLPVIIFSTSFDENVVDQLYKKGAQYYISKPADFSQLKRVIQQALLLIANENITQPPKEKFLLTNLKSIFL